MFYICVIENTGKNEMNKTQRKELLKKRCDQVAESIKCRGFEIVKRRHSCNAYAKRAFNSYRLDLVNSVENKTCYVSVDCTGSVISHIEAIQYILGVMPR